MQGIIGGGKMSVNEFIKGLTLMDWVQISGILTIVVTLVGVLVTSRRDTNSLKRDHTDLSKENDRIIEEQKNVQSKQSDMIQQMHNHQASLVDKISSVKNDSYSMLNLLIEQERRGTTLTAENRQISDALQDLTVFANEYSRLVGLNRQYRQRIEKLSEEKEWLGKRNQELESQVRELTIQLEESIDIDKGNDFPCRSL